MNITNKKRKPPVKVRKFGDKLEYNAREAFNTVRTNISFVFPDRKNGKVIGLTSAIPQDGKSSVSINLAYTLAKGGSSVLLVDADMRCPTLAKYLKLKGLAGLSAVLSSACEPTVYENVLTEGLNVLTAGTIPPNPSELLASETMKRFVEDVRAKYDYIIIDLPPVIPVTDPITVSPNLDGMIMVVRHAHSKKREVRAAVSSLEFSGVKILGFIYNGYRRGFGHYASNYRYK